MIHTCRFSLKHMHAFIFQLLTDKIIQPQKKKDELHCFSFSKKKGPLYLFKYVKNYHLKLW